MKRIELTAYDAVKAKLRKASPFARMAAGDTYIDAGQIVSVSPHETGSRISLANGGVIYVLETPGEVNSKMTAN